MKLRRSVFLLLFMGLLGATGKYTLGQGTCSPSPCQISVMSGTATVVNPVATPCFNGRYDTNYTFASSHSLTVNKTSGNGLSCDISWIAKLESTEQGGLSHSKPYDNAVGNGCGPTTFTGAIAISHKLGAIGNHVTIASTYHGSNQHGVDIECLNITP